MTAERAAAAVACCLVAAALAAGFSLIGSPQHTRVLALDERRYDDLRAIATALHERYERRARGTMRSLPQRLPAGLHALRPDGSDARRDPVSGTPYEYARDDARHFRLCARFAAADDEPGERYGVPPRHPAGRACFSFDVTESWPAGKPAAETM